MNELEYTYAVARVRALETSLLTDSVIDQLVNCKTPEQCLQILEEKGWGSNDANIDAEEMLKREEEKAWEVICDVAPDLSVFDVLSLQKVYHNLKAAIKAVCTDVRGGNIFCEDAKISGDEMMKIVKNKEFSRLPANMANAAKEAYETLLQTRDGQLCDIIIDRAALEAISEAGRHSKDAIIRDYAESTVAIADIKIAVRGAKTGKSQEFMTRAMASCDSLNKNELIKAALGGTDAVKEYLGTTMYAGGAAALEESPSAFERWCDNRMMETMRPQKYNAFSVGPLVAYLFARQNEIKTVRIILTGKQNGFSDEMIRERVRAMYV